MISVNNTMTKQKEMIKPIQPGKIGIYVCGMTVYDYCHIGHGRVLVVFDVFTRFLRYMGYEVTYVRNITDIDDKIIKRAQENNEPFTELTGRFINALKEDEAALGVLAPTHEPRATDYIPQMIQMIEQLIQNGYAYVADNGDVYYEVSRFKDYGCLAHQDLEKLRAGARVDIMEAKRDPLDFALWKLAKPAEPSWDSPWGKGRPGWHIECSVMATQLLGQHFDLHGGGLDLVFPHHQNEIAQSEGATKQKFVNFWMHVGFVQINEEKMSKSLGNFFTIRDVLAKYRAEVIRYFIVASHYSSPINYTEENLQSAEAALVRFYTCLRDLPAVAPKGGEEFEERFKLTLSDDFNTPQAFAVLFDLVREINRLRDQNDLQKAAELGGVLRKLANVFGILQHDSEEFLQQGESPEFAAKIEALINARNAARAAKDWQKADQIRQQLTAEGVILEDGAQGTTWRRG